MERTTIRVPLSLPRKRNTTSITTRKVIMMVSRRDLMVRRMSSELSTMVVILISEGRFLEMVFISCLIFLTTSTVLYPDCFWIMICAPRLPLV